MKMYSSKLVSSLGKCQVIPVVARRQRQADVPPWSGTVTHIWQTTLWRHEMEIFFALLDLCEENPSVTGHHHKGQWRKALMFSLVCTWTYDWESTRDVADLRHHRVHYGVTVMILAWWQQSSIHWKSSFSGNAIFIEVLKYLCCNWCHSRILPITFVAPEMLHTSQKYCFFGHQVFPFTRRMIILISIVLFLARLSWLSFVV